VGLDRPNAVEGFFLANPLVFRVAFRSVQAVAAHFSGVILFGIRRAGYRPSRPALLPRFSLLPLSPASRHFDSIQRGSRHSHRGPIPRRSECEIAACCIPRTRHCWRDRWRRLQCRKQGPRSAMNGVRFPLRPRAMRSHRERRENRAASPIGAVWNC
jgi:hypothetical protein